MEQLGQLADNEAALLYAGICASSLLLLYSSYRCCCRRKKTQEKFSTASVSSSENRESKQGRASEDDARFVSDVPPDIVCPPRKTLVRPNTGERLQPTLTSAAASYRYDRHYRGPSSFMPKTSPAYIHSPAF